MKSNEPIITTERELTTAILRLSDWVSDAQNNGNMSECRGRIETVIAWLQIQKQGAPADLRDTIDLVLTKLEPLPVGMPRPTHVPPLPDLSSRVRGMSEDELRKKTGSDAAKAIELGLDKAPPKLKGQIAFCLAASKGLPMPDYPLEYHEVFALCFRDFAQALGEEDDERINTAVENLVRWGSGTPLNTGFERKALQECIAGIIDFATAPPPPNKPSGFFAIIKTAIQDYRRYRSKADPYVQCITKVVADIENIRFF